MTGEQGDRHRWDERRSRCLDCGRDAATIAVELEDWLIGTEDSVDRLSDQIEAMRPLLENMTERLSPESAAHRYDQGRDNSRLLRRVRRGHPTRSAPRRRDPPSGRLPHQTYPHPPGRTGGRVLP